MPSLERMFENACTLRFSRLIVLMVGYLPLWVLISCTSSSPGFDLPYELYVRITARGESGFGSLLIDLVTEFMWSANAFKPPRILSLRVLSRVSLQCERVTYLRVKYEFLPQPKNQTDIPCQDVSTKCSLPCGNFFNIDQSQIRLTV